MMRNRFLVLAEVDTDGAIKPICVVGQAAKTLLALAEVGANGVTALEVSSWALRLAAYTHDLRRKHGLTIATEREAHPGVWHGRHILLDTLKIPSDSDDGTAPFAEESARGAS